MSQLASMSNPHYMLFKSIQLYFAKRKLRKLYSKVQESSAKKIPLRLEIDQRGKDLLAQLDVLKNKFNISNPKQYVIQKKRS
jgi:uncharacterized protein (UPF0216 family)